VSLFAAGGDAEGLVIAVEISEELVDALMESVQFSLGFVQFVIVGHVCCSLFFFFLGSWKIDIRMG